MEARVDQATKALLQRAAALQGSSLTDFVVSAASEAARKVVLEGELIELTERDRAVFLEALLNPPTPNERLRAAAERHRRLVAR